MKPPAPRRRRRQQTKRLRGAARIGLDIVVDSRLWQVERGVGAWLRRALCEAAAMAATKGGELAIVLTDDSAIRALNRDWRGKDTATNVLSFPAPIHSRRGSTGACWMIRRGCRSAAQCGKTPSSSCPLTLPHAGRCTTASTARGCSQ